MADETHSESHVLRIIDCAYCFRRGVDVASLTFEFGWRSVISGGKTRWRCAACLGNAPDLAALLQTTRIPPRRAA